MKRVFGILFAAVLFQTSLSAWGTTLAAYQSRLYDLFIAEKMSQWPSVLESMVADKTCDTLEGKYQILSGYYGWVGHLVDKKRKDEAETYLKEALALAEKYRRQYPDNARFKALYGNLLGFKIALSPLRATTLASGMLSAVNEAYKISPRDSWVSILYGNILLYMPGVFGGDKEKALDCYLSARRAMEKNLSECEHHWLYVQLLVSITLTYERTERYEQALELCQLIMEKYPDYGFVKRVIYSRLVKK